MEHSSNIRLPSLLAGQADILRLRRELESLEDYLHQAALRKTAPAQLKMPKTSSMLDEFAKLNQLNLLHRPDHEWAMTGLDLVSKHAPTLHISFSADPSAAFAAKVTAWIRTNIHPQALVQIGLQPSIAAGCVVRTPNHQFDLSLRTSFESHRGLLMEQLRKGMAKV